MRDFHPLRVNRGGSLGVLMTGRLRLRLRLRLQCLDRLQLWLWLCRWLWLRLCRWRWPWRWRWRWRWLWRDVLRGRLSGVPHVCRLQLLGSHPPCLLTEVDPHPWAVALQHAAGLAVAQHRHPHSDLLRPHGGPRPLAQALKHTPHVATTHTTSRKPAAAARRSRVHTTQYYS